MDDQTPAAPRAFYALSTLWAQAVEPGVEPATVAASDVLTALWTAATRVGGGDDHILHWLTNSPDLSRPRQALTGRRPRRSCRAQSGHRVTTALAALDAHDQASPERRRAVRELITHALDHAAQERR